LKKGYVSTCQRISRYIKAKILIIKMSEINIMIDLETLGVSTNSIILTLGAIAFDPRTGKHLNVLYERIDINSYKPYDRKFEFDGETLKWWTSQSQEARYEAFSGDRKTVIEVFNLFSTWCQKVSNGLSIKIWSHGATFDIPMTAYAMSVLNLPIPWKFWHARDTRTLFDIAGIDFRTIGSVPVQGKLYESHHALGDCAKQIEGVRQAFAKLGR
jgi:hypothetical protein